MNHNRIIHLQGAKKKSSFRGKSIFGIKIDKLLNSNDKVRTDGVKPNGNLLPGFIKPSPVTYHIETNSYNVPIPDTETRQVR